MHAYIYLCKNIIGGLNIVDFIPIDKILTPHQYFILYSILYTSMHKHTVTHTHTCTQTHTRTHTHTHINMHISGQQICEMYVWYGCNDSCDRGYD